MEGTCRLKRFLQKEHTPAEKAMLVSAAALIGAAAGIILFSASRGIENSLTSKSLSALTTAAITPATAVTIPAPDNRQIKNALASHLGHLPKRFFVSHFFNEN